jgi:predicted RND superfamily exporter protein
VRYRLARLAIRNRRTYLALIAAVTLFFALGTRDLALGTNFSDLLPHDHEHTHVFEDHSNFGSPLTVLLLVKRRHGDIYQPETLEKIWRLTREAELIPGVDHEQILSIASEKARLVVATPSGLDSTPLMGDAPPREAAEIEVVRARVRRAPGVIGFLVSADQSAALVRLTFIEQHLDYQVVFRHLAALAEAGRDHDHEVHAAGLPMLVGWVYFHERETRWMLALTLAAMVLALAGYARSIAGFVMPILVSAVSAVWAFGFLGWLGLPIEPLTLVVPVLIVARSFTHALQVTERYDELLLSGAEKRAAAEQVLSALLAPGTLSIATDAAALFLIAVTPIPLLERFGLFCGFWALALFPTNVVLAPVLLSVLPRLRHPERQFGPRGAGRPREPVAILLAGLARPSFSPSKALAGAVLVVIGALGVAAAGRVIVGNDTEGTPLLWEDSEYNRAVRAVNAGFPGLNTLEIVFEGKVDGAMRRSEAVHTMRRLQEELEARLDPPALTLSFADYLPEVNRVIRGGNPKWLPLEWDEAAVRSLVSTLLLGANPKAFHHVVDVELRHGVVTVWRKDLRPDTLTRTLSQAEAAIAEVGAEHDAFRIRLGSGNIALEQAVNERVGQYELVILGLLLVVIVVTCTIAYGSLAASVVLLIPVVLSNLLLAACMLVLGIGISVHTMPIAAIGAGIGIDYGIYLLSRLREEAHQDEGLERAIERAVGTAGKAIVHTSSVVVAGLLPWYFLSGLKFQADMGLLLTLVMLINMVIALVAVPYLVALIRPRFVLGGGDKEGEQGRLTEIGEIGWTDVDDQKWTR